MAREGEDTVLSLSVGEEKKTNPDKSELREVATIRLVLHGVLTKWAAELASPDSVVLCLTQLPAGTPGE